ncbi:MAG: tetratricopeptide repeat protein, partial [Planctomycetaceae bacterium]|nr:tetratricopeptide repeat protein [Planctomycetaceae bacterium]
NVGMSVNETYQIPNLGNAAHIRLRIYADRYEMHVMDRRLPMEVSPEFLAERKLAFGGSQFLFGTGACRISHARIRQLPADLPELPDPNTTPEDGWGEYYSAIVEFDPEDVAARMYLATLAVQQNDREAARLHIEAALQHAPDNPQVKLLATLLSAQQGTGM